MLMKSKYCTYVGDKHEWNFGLNILGLKIWLRFKKRNERHRGMNQGGLSNRRQVSAARKVVFEILPV